MLAINGKRVLLKKIETSAKNPYGMIAAPSSSVELNPWEVVQVPSGIDHIQYGDIAYVNEYKLLGITIDGSKLKVCEIEDVYLIQRKD
jgi:co-chaperonin GroES (HSP10)